MTPRQVQLIEDFGAVTIMVTPSYVLSILDEYREQGLDPRQSRLKGGIYGEEPGTNATRKVIEQAFDMRAVEIYGLSEVMGPGVANECVETKDGLRIWEDHFYPEVIDPVTGAVPPEGKFGEMLILRGVNVFPTQIEEQFFGYCRAGAAFPDRTAAGRSA
jgi:phenylacetate-CoA ligase